MAENRLANVRTGFRPKKRLGQHFLKDKKIVHEIIKRARFDQSDQVLEIGAGLGALTLPLSESVQEITAVEKDSRLTEMLRKKLQSADITNVVLINEDILKLDLGAVPHRPGTKLKVIGNLPYNISSPFLEKLVEHRNLVSKAVLMFQFELARRLIAKPGNREFGSMTVLMQYHANLSPLLKVSKESFYPKPRVGSMVLELDFERPHPNQAEDKSKFKMVVKGAFAHRRKTLLNSLRRTLLSCSDAEISVALQKCGIDPRRRAETLDIDDFLCLTSMLPSLS